MEEETQLIGEYFLQTPSQNSTWDEENLGTISLGILYTSFAAFSSVSSILVRMSGSKNALILGTTGYWLFIAANLKPRYTMVPASLYLGFVASIMWVGQGTYLTYTARRRAFDHNVHNGTVIAKFNGEFWGFLACHQGESTSGTTLLFIVFLCSMTLGTILMCLLQKRDSKKVEGLRDSSVSFYSLMISLSKSVINPLFDARLPLIIPLIAYSGLQKAFVSAEFTKYIVEPVLGEACVGGAMAVYGAFDAFCSLAAGQLARGLMPITLIVCGGAFALLWLLLKNSQAFLTSSGLFGAIFPFLIAAILGISNGVFNTRPNASVAMLSKHDTVMLIVMLVSLCISVGGFLFLTLEVERAFSSNASCY